MLVEELLNEKNWSDPVTNTKNPGTFAKQGIHTKSAEEIYKEYSKPRVSPHGPGSAIQMLQFFINRAGKNLSAERKSTLKRAMAMLRKDIPAWHEKHDKK